jgi:hypothetical protein
MHLYHILIKDKNSLPFCILPVEKILIYLFYLLDSQIVVKSHKQNFSEPNIIRLSKKRGKGV